jgi:hypothetical protein
MRRVYAVALTIRPAVDAGLLNAVMRWLGEAVVDLADLAGCRMPHRRGVRGSTRWYDQALPVDLWDRAPGARWSDCQVS